MDGEARGLPGACVAPQAMFGGHGQCPHQAAPWGRGDLPVPTSATPRSHSLIPFPDPIYLPVELLPVCPPSPPASPPLTLCPSPVCAEELWGEPGELQRGAAEAGAAPAGEGWAREPPWGLWAGPAEPPGRGGASAAPPPALCPPEQPLGDPVRWVGGAGTTPGLAPGSPKPGGPRHPQASAGFLLK